MMNSVRSLAVILLATAAMGVSPANAQGAVDDQAAVWAAVEAIWTAGERGDNDEMEQLLSADFMGWSKGAPTPRSKTSTEMWRKFGQGQSKSVQHELYPLSIVVHGDMAVAHYLYSNAVQARDESIKVSNGRYTDVLVRADGSWKFISWHGGDDSSADD